MFYKLRFGRTGETTATKHLKKAGLKILKQNWRCYLGEVDLICQSPDGTLVFAEVKSRSSGLEEAWRAFTADKQRRLHRLALQYLKSQKLPLETKIRFDAVLVLANGRVYHEPNAFQPKSEI